jgi:hypothetical protein
LKMRTKLDNNHPEWQKEEKAQIHDRVEGFLKHNQEEQKKDVMRSWDGHLKENGMCMMCLMKSVNMRSQAFARSGRNVQDIMWGSEANQQKGWKGWWWQWDLWDAH